MPNRPSIPSKINLVTDAGRVSTQWEYFFRSLAEQLPSPSRYALQSSTSVQLENYFSSGVITFNADKTVTIGDILFFPSLTGDLTNDGLVLTLNQVTTGNSGVLKVTHNEKGLVTSSSEVTTTDLTPLLDGTYVKVAGDTMTGPLTTAGITSPLGAIDAITTDFIQFDTDAAETTAVGKLYWDNDAGTLSLGLKGGNVTLQVGQEQVIRGYNRTGSAITDGQVVYVLGAHADDLEIGLADNTIHDHAVGTLGLATETIGNNSDGFVTTFGLVHDLNTSSFSEGDQLWLGAGGTLTNVIPTAPNNIVLVGYCVRSHPNQGIIFVRVVVRPDLSGLSDVYAPSPTDGQLIAWSAANSRWQVVTPTGGTVTSVAMTVPSFMSISGNPITTSGTLALSAASTGTGSVVLSTSPTLVTPNIGAAAGTSLTLTGDIQQNNAGYIRSKTSSGTSTRILGLNAANNLYIGSIDAAITSILANLGGTTYLTIGTTVSTFTTPVVVSTPTSSTHATTKAYVDVLTSFPGWTAPTLTTSWANFGGGYNDVGYYKDSTGRVYLRGLIKSGTIGSAAFTLPVGYRPAARCLFATISNAGLGRLDVDTSGTVIPITGSNVWFSLDNISFQTN